MLDSLANSGPTSLGTSGVGARLKLVREQNGLSQRELAKRANVTHSSISMIEQGQNSPSINSLEKILGGIPMTLAQFFICDPSHLSQVVHRSGELVVMREIESGITTHHIPHKNLVCNVLFQKLILCVGADTGAAPLIPSQHISGFIISGQLELTANVQVSTLQSGDAFALPATQAYRFRNLSITQECVLLICKA
ncbi:MAG: helix-turn-helix domain-containing protein [Pseudomonadota bacterium]